MAEKEFFDRKNELKLLQDKYNGLSPSEMVVLYGRRRVGKTELVKQFLKNIKNHFYFYVEVTQKSEILNYLSKSVEEQLVEKIMNSKAGALYGRAQKIKISPFKYSDFRLMFKEMPEEDKVMTYSVFGGTPDYLDKFKKSKGDIYERIFELVLKKGAVLFDEPKNLLEYENVRIHAKYNAILSATSSGKETLKEIEDVTK